jgi:putative transposase
MNESWRAGIGRGTTPPLQGILLATDQSNGTLRTIVTSGRRTGQLHRNRISDSSAVYFLTCCTQWRRQDLTTGPIATSLLATVRAADWSRDTRTFAFTVMPDHCHWLFELGWRLALGRVIAKLKVTTGTILGERGMEWQRDFYEHHLRPDETPEDYALYIFLNPYRAGLIDAQTPWPHWWSGEPTALRFLKLTTGGCPQSEWIGQAVPPTVQHGE